MNNVPLNAPRLVGNLMTAEPVVAVATASLAEAARLRKVVADDGETRPIGVLSASDLAHTISAVPAGEDVTVGT